MPPPPAAVQCTQRSLAALIRGAPRRRPARQDQRLAENGRGWTPYTSGSSLARSASVYLPCVPGIGVALRLQVVRAGGELPPALRAPPLLAPLAAERAVSAPTAPFSGAAASTRGGCEAQQEQEDALGALDSAGFSFTSTRSWRRMTPIRGRASERGGDGKRLSACVKGGSAPPASRRRSSPSPAAPRRFF